MLSMELLPVVPAVEAARKIKGLFISYFGESVIERPGKKKSGWTIGVYCNCILLNKLPRPRDSDGTFRSSNQAATFLPHTVEASHCPF